MLKISIVKNVIMINQKKKILIKGYINLNLGDDLFFKILIERYPNVEFYMISDSKTIVPFKKYSNVIFRTIEKPSLIQRIYGKFVDKSFLGKLYLKKYLKTVTSIKGIDAIVTIGGSIFIEKNNNTQKHSYLYDVLINKYPNMKFYFLGCNFGPFKSTEFLSDYERVFSHAKDVCFREQFSKDFFQQHQNVRVASDIVFQLKTNLVDKISKSIGFSLIDLSHRSDLKDFQDVYLQTIKEQIEKKISDGYKIRLFPFCKAEGDMNLITTLCDLLPIQIKEKVEIVDYYGNIDSFLKSFMEMEVIVATRFHAMILAILYGCKLYPIVYSKKMTNVLEELEFSGNIYNISDNISSLSIDDSFPLIGKPIYDVVKDSTRQFEKLDLFLNP